MEKVVAGTSVSLRNILFSTDFSRQSNSALAFALAIAQKYGSTLYAAHIVPLSFGLPASVREALQAMGAQADKEAREGMADLNAQLRGIPHEMLTRTGDIWTELSEIVRAKGIELIVIGTRGRTGVGKLLMGSVAERIFRTAPCPVLTVGPSVSGEPDSIVDLHEILFATDFSAESLAALPYAISLAQEDNARLYVLHVAGNPSERAAEALLKSRLRNLVSPDVNLSCEPKVLVEYGPPAQKILEIAEELATDLIVLGVKRTPVHFEASTHIPLATAYKVVSQAICPVLTVRR